MHKHFRMIAISEHLRNHGFDPDVYQHTRIPHIWQKLGTYYNLDLIDERESDDLRKPEEGRADEDEFDDKYVEFTLPQSDFFPAMMQRARADSSEAATSPPELQLSPPSSPAPRKRRRRETVSKTRATSVADTEDGTDTQPAVASPPAKVTRRGSRGRTTRAASQAKVEKAETTEEEAGEEEEEGTDEEEEEESGSGTADGDGDEEEEAEAEAEEEGSAEETGTPASRSTRASTRGRGRGRGRPRRTRR